MVRFNGLYLFQLHTDAGHLYPIRSPTNGASYSRKHAHAWSYCTTTILWFLAPNDMSIALGMVTHLCHFYDNYYLCSHNNALFECPETPSFTTVRLVEDLTHSNTVQTYQNQDPWVARMRMTPTCLIFKEETFWTCRARSCENVNS